jgi:AcrR family transcriptional regulator
MVREYSLTMGSRRDEFIDAGMRLFADRGYAATTVADIQTACGLAAGSGALYKHFTSKQALLEAGVRRYVADLEQRRDGFVQALPDDPAEALQLIALAVSGAMAGDRSIIRITMRDLEAFPELLDILWQGLLGALYVELADWLRGQAARERVAVTDPRSTAAVLLASLTYPAVLHALVGHLPGDVDTATYLEAWVESATATLRPVASGAS